MALAKAHKNFEIPDNGFIPQRFALLVVRGRIPIRLANTIMAHKACAIYHADERLVANIGRHMAEAGFGYLLINIAAIFKVIKVINSPIMNYKINCTRRTFMCCASSILQIADPFGSSPQ